MSTASSAPCGPRRRPAPTPPSGRCGRRSTPCRRRPTCAGGGAAACWCPPSRAPSPSCSAASRWPRPAGGCRWSAPPAHHHRHRTRPGRGRPRPAAVLPRGAIAFSAVAAGRAWLATSSGAALHGRRLSALAISPGAVWMVEGGRRGLHAVGIPGRPGRVRAAACAAPRWPPPGRRPGSASPTSFARAGGDRLYDMFGNGTHAVLVAAHATAPGAELAVGLAGVRLHPRRRRGDDPQRHRRGDVADPARVRPAPRGRRRLRPLRRPAGDRRQGGPGARRRHPPPRPRHCASPQRSSGHAEDRVARAAPARRRRGRRRSSATSLGLAGADVTTVPAAWPASRPRPAAAGSRSRCATPRERCA